MSMGSISCLYVPSVPDLVRCCLCAENLTGSGTSKQTKRSNGVPRQDWQSPVYVIIALQVLIFVSLLAIHGPSNLSGERMLFHRAAPLHSTDGRKCRPVPRMCT